MNVHHDASRHLCRLSETRKITNESKIVRYLLLTAGISVFNHLLISDMQSTVTSRHNLVREVGLGLTHTNKLIKKITIVRKTGALEAELYGPDIRNQI